jgi:Ca2+-binding EF-hand superfamily protein
MMHRKTLLKYSAFALAVGACAGTAHGFRGHAGAERDIVIADVEQRLETRFHKADTDGDGLISAEEFASTPLRPGPARPWRHGHHHPRAHTRWKDAAPHESDDVQERREDRRDAMADAVFDALDSDGDGLLSRAEAAPENVRAARRSVAKTRLFTHMDRDGSGTLDRSEVFHHVDRLKHWDSNGDGTLDAQERQASREALREAHRSDHPPARS